jgi:hypothetical protein
MDVISDAGTVARGAAVPGRAGPRRCSGRPPMKKMAQGVGITLL